MLRRRGIEPTLLSKRLLYASYVLSFALVFIGFHAAHGTAVSYAPFESINLDRIVFIPAGIPQFMLTLVAPAVVIAYVGTTFAAFALLRKKGSLSDLGPAILLTVSQAVWFSLPFAARYFQFTTGLEPIDAQQRIRDYVFMVALAHCLQYLWVTSYYARQSDGWNGRGRYYLKTLASGAAIWTLPAVFFAPDFIGKMTYEGGLALVIAAAVNLHHFILDGAIWKLRSTRIGGILIRDRRDHDEPEARTRSGWGYRATWGVATAGLAIGAAAFLLNDVVVPGAYRRGQTETLSRIYDGLAWVGRDSASARMRIAKIMMAESEEWEEAAVQLERSIELEENSVAYVNLSVAYAAVGRWDEAVVASEQALKLDPENPELLVLLSHVERARAGAAEGQKR
jgi:tetratricopeptide (TPR) repeat protein